MSAQTANTSFKFELPSLSYIDAKWEEPNLTAPVDSRRSNAKTGLAGWFARRLTAFEAWRQDQRAISELGMMSDHELMDIGLTRSDLNRVFDPAYNQDLRQRGARA